MTPQRYCLKMRNNSLCKVFLQQPQGGFSLEQNSLLTQLGQMQLDRKDLGKRSTE